MNNISVIGRVGRDPEVRQTSSGKSVASFSVAVDDPFNKDHTDWFGVTVFGKSVDFVVKYIGKGRRCAVDGRLSIRQWEDKEGNKRTNVDIIANNVSPIDWPEDSGSAPAKTADDWDDPFAD